LLALDIGLFAMPSTAPDVFRRYRLTVADYHRMGEVGILHEDARVELIEGEIINMPPIGSLHAGTVNYAAYLLIQACGEQAIVATQNPVFLDLHSEPQPDIALLRPRADFYRISHPAPADVLLVVEVADTSLAYDTQIKLPLYARHGIPEVWLVDLDNRQLIVHRLPTPDGFQDVRPLADLSAVTLLVLPGVTVNLSGLFA
jgi:Uma2 family endonuclease